MGKHKRQRGYRRGSEGDTTTEGEGTSPSGGDDNESTAAGSVNAERTKYRYAPEYSFFRKRVGAAAARLRSIGNRQYVSREKIAAAKKTIADERQRQAKEEVLDIKEAAVKNNQQLGADENNPVQRDSSIPHPTKNARRKLAKSRRTFNAKGAS